MERFIRKRKLHELEGFDHAYWQSKSPAERFCSVELISNPALKTDEHSQQEFPRVFKVTHRKRR